MGLFRKVTERAVMGNEFWLLERGTEGTAVILHAEATRQTTTDSGDGQRVFKIRLRVTLPGSGPIRGRPQAMDVRPRAASWRLVRAGAG